MTEQTYDHDQHVHVAPVSNPAEQVEYWITQGIAARTNLSQDEARKSAQHLIHQYHQDRAAVLARRIESFRLTPAEIVQLEETP